MSLNRPLMPKATAVWLVDNTTLTFDQIADFSGIHPLEVQGIADGDLHTNIVGQDPTANNTLTKEEIERCEGDANARLQLKKSDIPAPIQRTKGPRYTPVARRQEKPDAIAWLTKFHPKLTDAQIIKLIGTTKNTIKNIREKTHWNMANLEPRDPVLLGLCSQIDLDAAVEKSGGTPGPVEDENEGTNNRLAAVPEGVFERLGGGFGLGSQPAPAEPTAESVFGSSPEPSQPEAMDDPFASSSDPEPQPFFKED